MIGEESFWTEARIQVEPLIREFIKASPKRREIEEAMRERNG
jgi:hypothetical protein